MSTPVFTVEKQGYTWVVLRDGSRVYGPSCQAKAEEKRDHLERKCRAKQRDCLTCGASFLSWGPGNRMCGRCRTASSDVYQGAV